MLWVWVVASSDAASSESNVSSRIAMVGEFDAKAAVCYVSAAKSGGGVSYLSIELVGL